MRRVLVSHFLDVIVGFWLDFVMILVLLEFIFSLAIAFFLSDVRIVAAHRRHFAKHDACLLVLLRVVDTLLAKLIR